MGIGKKIATAREKRGITLRELEAMTGVSRALIGRIEQGYVKEPGLGKVVRLARALGVTLNALADDA